MSYSEEHKKSGIKAGDEVRVARIISLANSGWKLSWTDEMDLFVGKTGTVIRDDEDRGFHVVFLDDIWWFPHSALEKVEKVEKVEKRVPEFNELVEVVQGIIWEPRRADIALPDGKLIYWGKNGKYPAVDRPLISSKWRFIEEDKWAKYTF